MSRRSSVVAALAILAGCTIPETLQRLDEQSPPPELGRPAWVRYTARAGAVIGVIPGAVASLALLPITYPIALLADEPLGQARQEFLFLPVSIGASAGHFLLGAPADVLDWTFHRAWVGEPEPLSYEHVPPMLDVVPPPTGTGPGPMEGGKVEPARDAPTTAPSRDVKDPAPTTQPDGAPKKGET